MTHFRAAIKIFVAILALGTSGFVAAQAPSVSFDIVPAAAGANVSRQITINVPWPSGCLPTGATVIGNEIARKRTFSIRLNGNLQNFTRCGDIIVNYRASVRITPDAEGDLRALVVTDDGMYVGETTLHTRAAAGSRSQYDLTGMWFDPASYGSGLTFVHGFTRNDTLFGTWYVYDAQGAPRWYTIQGVQWKVGGLEAEGVILETHGNSVVCAPPFIGCPVAFAIVMPLARARIVMQGPNSAQIQAVTAEGAVLFTSNIVRTIF